VAVFNYSALDKNGEVCQGLLEGDTGRQVRRTLRTQGLTPLEVAEVSSDSKGAGRYFFKKRLSSTELALLTRQFATLVRSGTPLEEALRAVAVQSDKAVVKEILSSIRAKIMEGYSLAKALEDYPAIFSELYRATVAAGEEAGRLDVVFERLADYSEFRQQIRQKIGLALIYPFILTVVALAIIGALLAYVVPQIVVVFQSVGQELPLLTRFLIAVSAFLQEYGLIILLALLVGFLGVYSAMRREDFRFKVHLLLLRLPLARRFIKTINAANFARSFSILTASGVSVVQGMRLSAKVIWSLPIRAAILRASAKVREGESLAGTLAVDGYLPPISIHLIASGEQSSNLEEMLDKAAVIQEHEIETMVAASLGVFEPLLILFMGGIVLGIVMAILLPILDMNQLVR